MRQVDTVPLDPTRLFPLLRQDRLDKLRNLMTTAAAALSGRTVWNVNSTAAGGGVAEMLAQVLAYSRGAGVDTEWLVLGGEPDFFRVTKRLHNQLHGQPGDHGELGATEREVFEGVRHREGDTLAERVRPGDVVVLHDPQPLSLAAVARKAGAHVVWRCHIGTDAANETSDAAWEFVRPYLDDVDVSVFSRAAYAPPYAATRPCTVIMPAIDPLSPKNIDLPDATVLGILAHIGVIDATAGPRTVQGDNGGTRQLQRRADVVRLGPPPAADEPLVVQVSRWDRLKDMVGVLQGFAFHVLGAPGAEHAHLALVGPATAGVADDPEGHAVYEECVAAWHALPDEARRRVALVSLPMEDLAENAAMVNAVQRHAAVVTQKSLAEGFGLTVSEAMWKARPVVATRTGGIVDQVSDGTGVLIDDAQDLRAFGAAVAGLLSNPERATAVGAAARERVRERFLPDRQLTDWATLLLALDGT